MLKSKLHRLVIDSSIFNEKDTNGIFNWLMEIRGFNSSIRIEQLSVWFAYRDKVVYESTDELHVIAFCDALKSLDMEFEHKIVADGI